MAGLLDAKNNPPSGVDSFHMVVVHGDCPKGGDRLAARYARLWSWGVEPHPANWRDLGKRAGFVRNEHMVNTMPDLVVAFIVDGSHGATHCAGLAEEAGIPVRYYRSTAAQQPIIGPPPGDLDMRRYP